jgi:hypothetical protein
MIEALLLNGCLLDFLVYNEMEAVRSSETSVNLYQTARRHILDDTTLHTSPLWKLKIQQISMKVSKSSSTSFLIQLG